MTADVRREIADYLLAQPFGDEHLTDDDIALLLFLSTFRVQHGRVPRYGEIAEARGLTRQEAKSAVRRLRALGQLGGYYEQPVYLTVVPS